MIFEAKRFLFMEPFFLFPEGLFVRMTNRFRAGENPLSHHDLGGVYKLLSQKHNRPTPPDNRTTTPTTPH
ncbi:hypothetical protein ACFVJ4_43825, partial [Streptomyces sp. NPDC127178]|uniref:hypothetical protein n=1 Tax=Streptomyces sp. NPDC127178 TaxID=3345385 RepID=UPI0036250A8C